MLSRYGFISVREGEYEGHGRSRHSGDVRMPDVRRLILLWCVGRGLEITFKKSF
jgi:hypothetical protein